MSDEDENGLGNSVMKWTLIGAIIGAGFFLVKGNMGFLANLFVGAVLGVSLRWIMTRRLHQILTHSF